MLKTENNKIIFLYDSLMNPKVQKTNTNSVKIVIIWIHQSKDVFFK